MNSSAQVSVNLRSFLVIVKFNLWNLSLLCWNPFFFFFLVLFIKKNPDFGFRFILRVCFLCL
jgi:hypothetical protein